MVDTYAWNMYPDEAEEYRVFWVIPIDGTKPIPVPHWFLNVELPKDTRLRVRIINGRKVKQCNCCRRTYPGDHFDGSTDHEAGNLDGRCKRCYRWRGHTINERKKIPC